MTRRSIVLPLVAVAALAATGAAGLPITAGHAQSGPRTITITNGKGKIVFDDLPPREMKRGKLSLGDRIVQTQQVLIDGKPAGTVSFEGTIVNRNPTTFSRFKATERITGHLSDGEIFAIGYVDAATGGHRSTVIGGTGAYTGAQGTIVAADNGAVITLDG